MNTIRRGQGRSRVQSKARVICRRHRRPLWNTGMVGFAALATLLLANTASAKDDDVVKNVHEITWIHAFPGQVRNFIIYVSPVPGTSPATRQIDVGKPGPSDGESAQLFSALVPVGVDDFVAVAAIGQNGLASLLSNWGQPQPSRPGQPLVVEP